MTPRPIRAPCGWALRTAGRDAEGPGSQCRNPELLTLGITGFLTQEQEGLGQTPGALPPGPLVGGLTGGLWDLGTLGSHLAWRRRWWRQRGGGMAPGRACPRTVTGAVPDPQCPRVPVLRQHPRPQEQHEAPAHGLCDLHPVRPPAALRCRPRRCPCRLPLFPGAPLLYGPLLSLALEAGDWPQASCASHPLRGLGRVRTPS